MTNFEYQPIKKIIVRQIVNEDFQTFVDKIIIPNNIYAKFCDGILFTSWPAPRSEVIAKNEMDGIYVWELVIFTKCERNPGTVKKNGGMVEIPVEDVSKKEIYKEFSRWIKSRPEWN